jgi:hypothetical protein
MADEEVWHQMAQADGKFPTISESNPTDNRCEDRKKVGELRGDIGVIG